MSIFGVKRVSDEKFCPTMALKIRGPLCTCFPLYKIRLYTDYISFRGKRKWKKKIVQDRKGKKKKSTGKNSQEKS